MFLTSDSIFSIFAFVCCSVSFFLENADRQALWDVLLAWWVQATPPWGIGPHWTTVIRHESRHYCHHDAQFFPVLQYLDVDLLSDFAGKIWCGTQQSSFCGRFREEHPIGEARSEMLRFFCNTHRRIVASYLPEFRCYRLVSPKQFPFSMALPMDFQLYRWPRGQAIGSLCCSFARRAYRSSMESFLGDV